MDHMSHSAPVSHNYRKIVDNYFAPNDFENFGLMLTFHFRHHTSHSLLELAVLCGIDERVDATVDEH